VFVVSVTNLPSHYEIGRPHVEKMSRVRLALGLHPLATDHHEAEMELFDALFNATSFIGEVGLDFSRKGKSTKERQLVTFRHVAQRLAHSRKFVTVHSRGAEREVLALLRDAGAAPVVLHWYSGSLGVLDEALADGHLFSVNPAMTRSESGRKIIARIPKERLLTETDGPYVNISGKPAAPVDVRVVERYLAQLWQMSELDVRSLVWSNFRSSVAGIG
jgi:TatD DNase family protein